MRLFVLFLITLLSYQAFAQVKVQGYYRKDGTYVKPHYRSSPDGNPYNNWSYPGNVNPYTGKKATGNPDTYLDNYYNNPSSSTTSNSQLDYYLSPSSKSSNSSYSYYYVAASSLNVRTGPSTNFSVIKSLSYSDDVQVIESLSNGWKKVKFTYYDPRSYQFTVKTGYVAGKYLTSTNPKFNDSYIDYFFNSNPFSSPTTTSKPSNSYNDGKGKITFWTDFGTDGEIRVYLDDVYVGRLSEYFTEGTPDCDESGTLSTSRPAGTYKLFASGNEYTWEGNITITPGECSLHKLE